MKYIFSTIIILLLNCADSTAQTYNWPCVPFDQQHWVNGTFCENRISGSILIHHFHDGVDIHLPQNNNVYSVINGNVTGIATAATAGINSYVRVSRYAYVHVDPSPAMGIGTPVTAFQTVLGTTNSWNHIHFKDGNPGAEINALRSGGGLDPFVDSYNPSVDWIKYYINGTTTEFIDGRVSGLVEIVSKAQDKSDNGPVGSNNGIYKIGYQIYDAAGTTPITSELIRYQFDQKPSNSNITNVYFSGSDLSNYIYTLTNTVTSDGYWDTRSVSPGTYQLRVFTEDTRNNTHERWRTVEVVPQDVSPPATPVVKALVGDAANHWQLDWRTNDSTDVGGYELYLSYHATSWLIQSSISNGISAADTVLDFEPFSNSVTIYFRLAAHDNAAIPNVSDTSDAYGVRLSATGPQVLIVDGFDRTGGYWLSPSHTFITKYGKILTDLNIAFNSCANEAVINGDVQLDDYSVVIYMLGDEKAETEAVSTTEQDFIRSYLQNGGNLIISGSDIGFDLVAAGSAQDSVFFADYLKAKYVLNISNGKDISGAAGTFLAGWEGLIVSPGGRILQLDVIEALDSETILTYSNGNTAAVNFNGIFPGGTGNANVTYCAFPIELIADPDQRLELLTAIIDQFDLATDLSLPGQQVVPEKYLLSNYPNPFNPLTQIQYELPEPARVSIIIYDVNGKMIKQLFNGVKSTGKYTLTWDGKDRFGNEVSSGVYIYRLQANHRVVTKKMMLLK